MPNLLGWPPFLIAQVEELRQFGPIFVEVLVTRYVVVVGLEGFPEEDPSLVGGPPPDEEALITTSAECQLNVAWLKLFDLAVSLMHRGYPEMEYSLHCSESEVIRQTYKLIKAETDKVRGVKTFLKLFQSCSASKVFTPTVKDASVQEGLALEMALGNHALMIVKVRRTLYSLDPIPPVPNILAPLSPSQVVDDLVAEGILDNASEKPNDYLLRLGRMHQRVGIRRPYLDIMGPIFVQAIRPMLQAEGRWSNEVRLSWLHFFRVISYRIKQGYEDGLQTLAASNRPSSSLRPSTTPQRRATAISSTIINSE